MAIEKRHLLTAALISNYVFQSLFFWTKFGAAFTKIKEGSIAVIFKTIHLIILLSVKNKRIGHDFFFIYNELCQFLKSKLTFSLPCFLHDSHDLAIYHKTNICSKMKDSQKLLSQVNLLVEDHRIRKVDPDSGLVESLSQNHEGV